MKLDSRGNLTAHNEDDKLIWDRLVESGGDVRNTAGTVRLELRDDGSLVTITSDGLVLWATPPDPNP